MEKIQNDEEVYNCSKFLLRKFELSKKLYRNYSSNKPVNNELNRTQYQLAYDIFFKIANLYCDVRFINAALKIADLKGLNDKKNSEIFIGEQVKRILK
jgi:hypothetical protein